MHSRTNKRKVKHKQRKSGLEVGEKDLDAQEDQQAESETQAKKMLKPTFKVRWAHKPCVSFNQRKKEGGKNKKIGGGQNKKTTLKKMTRL